MFINYLKNPVVGAVLFMAFSPVSLSADNVKLVSGWVEKITIGSPSITLNAKIDTGATHSSLHAAEYHIFNKAGIEWVRFSVTDNEGNDRRFEVPLLRYAEIKQKNNQPAQLRPVIMLGICLGSILRVVEVNLADRSNFNYPVLIGHSFLQGNFLVDVDRKFLHEPNCQS